MIQLKKYANYFHDGTLLNIIHKESDIQLMITSAEMDMEDLLPEDRGANNILSRDDTIQGKIHIDNVSKVTIGKEKTCDFLKMQGDFGIILDFEVYDCRIEIGVEWHTFPCENENHWQKYSYTIIEAKKIWWENIPNLEDQYP